MKVRSVSRRLFGFAMSFLLVPLSSQASPFLFSWRGNVAGIFDGFLDDAALPGVDIEDSFLATLVYDTDAFAPGILVDVDGVLVGPLAREYAAPAGLEMHFSFESGAAFDIPVSSARVRDFTPNLDSFQWRGVGSSGDLFQTTDYSDSSFIFPMAVSFDLAHVQLLASFAAFSTGFNVLQFQDNDPSVTRYVLFENESFRIVPIPEPTAGVLVGAGLVALAFRRRTGSRPAKFPTNHGRRVQ